VGIAVEELQTPSIGKGAEIGRDRFDLTGHAGRFDHRHHTGKRRDHELTSIHRPL
jgi:hypothetical protein